MAQSIEGREAVARSVSPTAETSKRLRRPARIANGQRTLSVWLDMANSPHPVLLGPVADELEQAGHEVWVTSRDHAQTADLTLCRWPDATVLGGPSPSSRARKTLTLMGRVQRLGREAGRRRPDVALSLNSYAQVIAARTAGVPSVTLMDYEFQPANHVSFRLAQRVVVPSAFPAERLRHYGARSTDRIRWLGGYKEELYLDHLSGLAPGGDGWSSIPGAEDSVRCLFRPPPSGATYHRGGNGRFDDLLARTARQEDVSVLVLPRFPEQREKYREFERVTVAEQTLDGLRALLGADVFVGAGGTMCREASLLGVPAYTVFAGRLAAVDAQLIAEGRLRDLRLPNLKFEGWVKRDARASQLECERVRDRAAALRRSLISVVEDVAGMRAGAPQPAIAAG